jgi:hypothetical protein
MDGRLGSHGKERLSKGVEPSQGGPAVPLPGLEKVGALPVPGERPLWGLDLPCTATPDPNIAKDDVRNNITASTLSLWHSGWEPEESGGETVYQCQEVDAEFAAIRRILKLSGATLVGRVTVWINNVPMNTCVDTGATFSLLANKFYEEHCDQLPLLQPPSGVPDGRGWRVSECLRRNHVGV